jgi:flagellar basal body rod protein FlgG
MGTNKQTRLNTTSNNLRNIIALSGFRESRLTGLADNEVVVLILPQCLQP